MFEQAAIAVTDEQGYAKLHALIDAAFDARDVEVFLNRVRKAKLRVRDYEEILGRGLLGKGLLGAAAKAKYKGLGNADQGQIREFYLASLEQVAPDVREKFFKLYAYY